MAFCKAVSYLSDVLTGETASSLRKCYEDDGIRQELHHTRDLLLEVLARRTRSLAAQYGDIEGYKSAGNLQFARSSFSQAVLEYSRALSCGNQNQHLRAVLLANRVLALSKCHVGAKDCVKMLLSDTDGSLLALYTYAKAWHRKASITDHSTEGTLEFERLASSLGATAAPPEELKNEACVQARKLFAALKARGATEPSSSYLVTPYTDSTTLVSDADRSSGKGYGLMTRHDVNDAGDGSVLAQEQPIASVPLFTAQLGLAANKGGHAAGPLTLNRCSRCMCVLSPLASVDNKLGERLCYGIPCTNYAVCGAIWCSAACMAQDWASDHMHECGGGADCTSAAKSPFSRAALYYHLLPREVTLAMRLLRRQASGTPLSGSGSNYPAACSALLDAAVGTGGRMLLRHAGSASMPGQQLNELSATAMLAAELLIKAHARPAGAASSGGSVPSPTALPIHADICPIVDDPAMIASVQQDAQRLASSLLTALCQLVYNVHGIKVPEHDGARSADVTIGLGVYALGSLANHSCAPSAVTAFSGHTMSLVALTPLAAGQEVTISYGPDASVEPSVDRRREQLQRKYAFICGCAACSAQLANELLGHNT